jgi:outer membrane protein assembly factor BamB
VLLGAILGSAWMMLAPAQAKDDAAVAYQITPAHDGHAKTTLKRSLVQKWVRKFGGSVSYPLIANGMVFVTVPNSKKYGDELFAINLNTGEVVWKNVIHSKSWGATAAYDNGRVFVVNPEGVLQAFSADATGTLQWSVKLRGQYAFSAPPMAVNGQVFVGGAGSGGTLYAVDQATGALNWSVGVENGEDSSPAFGDGGIYVTYPCQYYKFSPKSGALLWNPPSSCDGGGGATPAYHSGRLYSPQDQVILDAGTGATVGSLGTNIVPAFSKTSDGDHQFALVSGNLTATDLATGEVLWSFAGDRGLITPPIVVGSLVAVGSQFGEIYLVNAKTGSEVWSANAGASIQGRGDPLPGLSAAEGMLIVPAENLLVAYGPAN